MQVLICTRIYASLALTTDFRTAVLTKILLLCYVVKSNQGMPSAEDSIHFGSSLLLPLLLQSVLDSQAH
jgi:hypothetical protein